jgi:hypothetical protein
VSRATKGRLLRAGAALAVFLALGVALLGPTLLGGDRVLSAAGFWVRLGPFPAELRADLPPDTATLSDSVLQFVPWLRYAADHVAAEGHLPLWKDTSLCGAPFAGNGQSALFHPAVLAAILLGAPPWVHGTLALGKLVGGAFCAWLLARHLRLSFLASLLCGVVFGFGGFQAVWLLFPHTHVSMVLPLVLLLADRAVLAPSARSVGLLALAAGLQHLGGHPETAFHSQVVALACAGVRAVSLRDAGGRSVAARLGAVLAGLALGAAVGAVQVLPLLEYLALSEALQARQLLLDAPALHAPGWSALFVVALLAAALAFRRLAAGRAGAWPAWRAGLVLLLAGGAAFAAGERAGLSTSSVQVLASDWHGDLVRYLGPAGYVGSNGAFAGAALPLAAVALLHARTRGLVRLLGAALLLGLLSGYRAPVVTDLFELLPGFSVAANERLQFVALLAVALLAGLGLDALGTAARAAGTRTRLALACAVPALAVLGALALLVGTGRAGSPNVPQRTPGAGPLQAELVTEQAAPRLAAMLPEVPRCTEPLLAPGEGRAFTGVLVSLRPISGARLVYGRDRSTVYARVAQLPELAHLAGLAQPAAGSLRYAFQAVLPHDAFPPGRPAVRLWARLDDGTEALSGLLVTPDEPPPPAWAFPARPLPGRASGQLALLAAVALLAVIALHARGPLLLAMRMLLAGGAAAGTLLFTAHVLPVLDPVQFYPRSPAIDALSTLGPQSRMVNLQDHRFLPELPTWYGLRDACGYDALYPLRTAALLRAALDLPNQQRTKAPVARRNDPDLRLLGLMAVRALADHRGSPPSLPLQRVRYDDDPCVRPFLIASNPFALPRARLVGGAVVEPDDGAALALLQDPGFPRESVVLLAEGRGGPPPHAAPGSAAIVVSEPDRVRVEIAPGAPGWLVLADTDFPGWVARVDGRERPIVRANLAFRAVAVTPGDQVVEFRYEPISFRAGAALSVLAVLGALLACLRREPR